MNRPQLVERTTNHTIQIENWPDIPGTGPYSQFSN